MPVDIFRTEPRRRIEVKLPFPLVNFEKKLKTSGKKLLNDGILAEVASPRPAHIATKAICRHRN
jgi:hypothetical protein